MDTHIWLGLCNSHSRLSAVANQLIADEESQNGLLISAILVWEVAVTAVFYQAHHKKQIAESYCHRGFNRLACSGFAGNLL